MPSISNVTVRILVVRHPDDGHKCDQNMLVKNNNMWLNMVTIMHLLVHYTLHKSPLFNNLKQKIHFNN